LRHGDSLAVILIQARAGGERFVRGEVRARVKNRLD